MSSEKLNGSSKKYNLKLTELDVLFLLRVLGTEINVRRDMNQSAREAEILVEKIYRSMGVRL